MTDCIFFLSIFPNTAGLSVVVTKRPYPNYAFDLSDHVLAHLVLAAKRVGCLLDGTLEDVGRTGNRPPMLAHCRDFNQQGSVR